jgi:hypothetical protein
LDDKARRDVSLLKHTQAYSSLLKSTLKGFRDPCKIRERCKTHSKWLQDPTKIE